MSIIAKLWERSVLITGLIALALTGTSCYIWVTNNPLPDRLWSAWLIVLTFFTTGKLPDLLSVLRRR